MKGMLGVIVLLAAVAGCVSTGTQVKDSALTQFQKGVTTEAEVVKALGPPQSTSSMNGERYVVYAGAHAQAKAASFIPVVGLFAGGASSQSSIVAFRFGADGRLVDWSSTQSNVGSTSGVAAGYQPPSPTPTVVK